MKRLINKPKLIVFIAILFFVNSLITIAQNIKETTTYSEVINNFKQSNLPRIALFCPNNIEKGSKKHLLYDAIFTQIANSHKYYIQFVEERFLTSYEALFTGTIDVIILPEAETLSSQYYNILKSFMDNGGSLIIAGKDLLMTSSDKEQSYQPSDYFRKSIAKIGIKPYCSETESEFIQFDKDFMLNMSDHDNQIHTKQGIYCNTSSDKLVPEPLFGNTFPERYPVLRNYIVAKGCDEYKRFINSPVVFTQNWENGSNMAVFASNDSLSLFHHSYKDFDKIVLNSLDFCINKLVVSYIEPEFACYRKAEPVKVSFTLCNFGLTAEKTNVSIYLKANNKIIQQQELEVQLMPKSSAEKEVIFTFPGNLTDYYEIEVVVKKQKRVVSKAENAFIVWNDDVAKNGPSVSLSKQYFLINNKPSVFTGTNYYESEISELMWVRPNIKKLNDDLSNMSSNGINFIRIHYNHAKWFHDYFKAIHSFEPEYFTKVSNSYLPDKKILSIYDAHIYLCQKYGIVYGGDIFTLVPSEMGDPRGWMNSHAMGMQDLAVLQDKKQHQKEFLNLLVPRYKNVPGIIWDLINEPDMKYEHMLCDWGNEIKAYIKKFGDNHLISTGLWSPLEAACFSDFLAPHRNYYNLSELKAELKDNNQPIFFQEVWLDRPQTIQGESMQQQSMYDALLTGFSNGICGFSPWQWTNRACLWQDRSASSESWDDNLGVCVRNDGSIKPSGLLYKDFAWLLRNIEFLDYSKKGINTKRGMLQFDTIKVHSPGKFKMVESNKNSIYAAISEDYIQWQGKTLISANVNCDIWAFTPDEKGLNDPKNLFVKTITPSTLKIYTKKTPLKVVLKYSPTLQSDEVNKVEWVKDNDFIEIELNKQQTAYWINIVF
jgi:hypothetical protein